MQPPAAAFKVGIIARANARERSGRTRRYRAHESAAKLEIYAHRRNKARTLRAIKRHEHDNQGTEQHR